MTDISLAVGPLQDASGYCQNLSRNSAFQVYLSGKCAQCWPNASHNTMIDLLATCASAT